MSVLRKSLCETAIINPSSVEVTAIKNTAKHSAPVNAERLMKRSKDHWNECIEQSNNLLLTASLHQCAQEMGASAIDRRISPCVQM